MLPHILLLVIGDIIFYSLAELKNQIPSVQFSIIQRINYIFLVGNRESKYAHYHIKKCVDILGGRTYPVRHYPIALRLRDREGRAFLCITLNPQSGDSSGVMLGVRSVALLHLYLSSLSANNLHKVTTYLRNVLTSKNIF